MKPLVALLLVLLLLLAKTSDALKPVLPLTRTTSSRAIKPIKVIEVERDMGTSTMGTPQPEPKQQPIRDMIARAGMDMPSMLRSILLQCLVVNGAVALAVLFGVDIVHFDTSTTIFSRDIWHTVVPFVSSLVGECMTNLLESDVLEVG
jgi:hypothetical protein